jgi:5-methylcytosine-specific restriction endonuclease McrA
MQSPTPDVTDFVKAAPPDLRNPESCPALVLNADFRPLSYYPLSLWSWQDTVKAVFLDRVNIVSEYQTVVHSPTTDFILPSVVSLKTYVKPQDLTFDHVIPRRAGGRTTWENVVAACSPCNLRKGGRMPKQAKMMPRHKPMQPTVYQLHENGRRFPPNYCHDSWHDYLYWDTELEP